MNLIKNFRKPYISFFFAFTMLFFSCSQYDSIESSDVLTGKKLAQIHSDVNSLNHSNGLLNRSSSDYDINDYDLDLEKYEQELQANFEYQQEFGLERLFIKEGINPEMIEWFEFYNENSENENVYDLLLEKYEIKSEVEAEMLFQFVETYKIALDYLNQNGASARAHWGWCALAIAGTVVATASAVTIAAGTAGAGTALAFWLVGKAISTAGIVGSCS